jgi:simple sugar transport system substrate-binding protein
LIAQKVDAINVVPMSPEILEPVLKKAMDNKIVVITHEASNQQNMDWDIEAFNNSDFGAHIMDSLAKAMGEEGTYAVYVGSLTSKTHNEWVDAGIARQKEKYPKMQLIAEGKQETFDDKAKAYDKTKELLKKYPDLKGIQGSCSTDAPGAAQAVIELGRVGKTFIAGTGLVPDNKTGLEAGATVQISFWDPADAGYAMNKLALMIKDGKGADIKDGMDLGIPGYNKILMKGKVLYGQAWADANKENMATYDWK